MLAGLYNPAVRRWRRNTRWDGETELPRARQASAEKPGALMALSSIVAINYLLLVVLLPMASAFAATIVYTLLTGKPPLVSSRISLQLGFEGAELPNAQEKIQVANRAIDKTRTNSILISSKQRSSVQIAQQNKNIAIDALPTAHEPTSNSITGRKVTEREKDQTYALVPLLIPPSSIAHLPRSYSRTDTKSGTKPQTNQSPDDLTARKPVFIRESKKQLLKQASYTLETDRKREREVDGETTPNETASMLAPTVASIAEERSVKSLLEMRQKHVVVQQWDLSCGAAALATLFTYQYGDKRSERDTTKALIKRAEYIKNPNVVRLREGFSLLDLKRVANERGYKGVAYGQLGLDDIIQKAPLIVPINALGYNHFVVFRGVMGNRVLLADPAYGNRTMPIEKFQRLWLDYPEIGHVGFVLETSDGQTQVGQLAPDERDFLMLN